MAPPLAGSMNMRLTTFLRLDLAGAALYIGSYCIVGYVTVQRRVGERSYARIRHPSAGIGRVDCDCAYRWLYRAACLVVWIKRAAP